jgi:hypothetical protein
MSIGRPVRDGREDHSVQDVPDGVSERPVAPDGGDPPKVDRLRDAQRGLYAARTQHLIRTLFKEPRTAEQLTISERLTPEAVINTIQEARGQGFIIVAKPGPPVTFHFKAQK